MYAHVYMLIVYMVYMFYILIQKLLSKARLHASSIQITSRQTSCIL